MTEPTVTEGAVEAPSPLFVQYLFLTADPAWRRLPADVRERGRREACTAVTAAAPRLTTWAYSTLGLKTSADLMLWWKGDSAEFAQETIARLLQTGLGQYLTISHSLWGLIKPSIYTKRRTAQEQAIDEETRLRYLIVYPFTKTMDWHLLTRDVRQGFMNEHMRVGHEFEDVRQVLLYSTGLDDQEFIVAYETDELIRQHDLVVALRNTDSRKFTLRDTPIFTCIHRPLDEALALLG